MNDFPEGFKCQIIETPEGVFYQKKDSFVSVTARTVETLRILYHQALADYWRNVLREEQQRS